MLALHITQSIATYAIADVRNADVIFTLTLIIKNKNDRTRNKVTNTPKFTENKNGVQFKYWVNGDTKNKRRFGVGYQLLIQGTIE